MFLDVKKSVRHLSLSLLFWLPLSSCENKASKQSKAESSPVQDITASLSQTNEVHRRRSQQLKNSLSKILVVDKQGMCLELGKHPCIDQVHRVFLGSMDAYNASQYQNPVQASIGSVGSLERVVLSACIMRAGMDLLNPSQGVIFKNVKTSLDGRLVDDAAIDESIKTLYRRSFTREATAQEISHLRNMYEDIYKEEPIASGRNWMVLSCFAVLSSLEMAFF